MCWCCRGQHYVTLADLPAPCSSRCSAGAADQRRDAGAYGGEGSFVAMNNIVSQSVPHLHVHVVPRTKGDGLRGFFWPRGRYATDEEAAGYAAGCVNCSPAQRRAQRHARDGRTG